MKLRDRIKDLRRVKASELRPHPSNWRVHPEAQQNALRGVLAEVGIADALLARECEDGSLMLIDGHLRSDLDPGTKWPVLILDVTEEEANMLLATVDPLAGMAEPDPEKLEALLAEVSSESEAVEAMLADLRERVGQFDVDGTDMPDLADGDREPFQQMTFTLHDSQAEAVKAAIDRAKAAGGFDGSLNENSNGNALARICEAYNGTG